MAMSPLKEEILMQKIALLLALLSTEPTHVPSIPPGTIIRVEATVCVHKNDMDTLVDAEVRTGKGSEVFASLDGCDNYCIMAAVVREERRFVMRKTQLYAVFQVIGLSGSNQTFWAATAILPSGWPIPTSEETHQSRCAEGTPA